MEDVQDGASPAVVRPRLLVLAAGELRLVLAPDAGGSIAAFTRQWREGSRLRELHWLRPASASGLAAANPLEMASFPLVPFCNRIRDGRASFGGREIRMPRNHPGDTAGHPLHGIGWLLPWELASAAPAEAVLALRVPADAAWPWSFSARQHFTLHERALQVTMTVRNEDTAVMPLGIGHHPYFPHHPGTRLRSPAAAMWQADAEVMPTRLDTGGPVPALREGVELSRLDLDNNFTGWERSARIDWPADAHGPRRCLVMEAEPPLDHFVLYCPRGQDHFCAEPVGQCTDWLNLLPRHGRDALGGAELAPGETLSVRFVLRPDWDGAGGA
ncbi:aldose 1-epimerase [Ramlibacter sp. USB13]|uniref:Aldose 1-epimerase n=1 Tax=Ramlibacter cellulosilyticus TaxID=2764187 RepID=A0A923MT80_9BURK|nr:aldose 1-epimerase [Ramlibacter cellulosilyticus]MBC5784581.1 aldose 1-epimerase [Ramlibacter cellulosilyticus]